MKSISRPQSLLLILAALLAIAFAPLPAAAQTIFWGAPTTISGDTDVSTLGTGLYAYTGGSAQTVNTVAFTAQTGFATWGSVTLTGLAGETTSAFGPATAPFSNLTSGYKGILQGGAYATSGTTLTVALGGLTANTKYLVQIWLDDSRGTSRTETTTGNGVTLSYCTSGAAGGVGQYAIGYFIATGTSASFTLTANGTGAQQLNAIQVRSLGTATLSAGTWTKNTTGVQNWGTSANWSSGTIAEGNANNANFNTLDLTTDLNPQLDAPRVINSLTFGDTATATAGGWLLNGATAASCILVLDGTTPTITANALGTGKTTTIGTTLSGNSGLTKAGAGTLTLSSTTAYSGNTTINASSGTLQIGGAAQLFFGSYSGTISIGSGSMFEYSSSAAQTLSGAISGSGVLVKDTGTGTLILSALNTYTGNTTNNAGTLQISGSGSLGSGSYAGNMALGGGATLEYSSSAAQTLSGVISGGGVLTKDTASSTLTLTGANTYTGATTINAGTLAINSPGSLAAGSAVNINSGSSLAGNGTINGTVSVSSGGNLAPGGSGGIGTIGTLTLGISLTLNSGSLLTCDLGTTSGSSDLIAITGGLVLNGTSTVVFYIPSGGAAANATYTIMTFTGSPTGSGTLVFPNGTTTMNGATLHINSGSVTITTGASGITGDFWNVAGNGTWDINTSANWKISGTTGLKYTDGDAVTFDDSIGSGKNPTVSGGTVNPSSVSINNNANTYTISAVIGNGNSASLNKSGSGQINLTGANTFSGGSIFNGGIINVGANASGFGAGSVTINAPSGLYNLAGGSLSIANSLTLNGGFLRTGGGSGSVTWSGPVTLGTSGCLLGGDGGTAAITLSGGITINSSGSSISSIPGGSFGASITTGTVTGTGGVLSLTNLGAGFTISAPISGAFNIYNGGGTVTLSGSNPSFTGSVRSQAGTLSIGNANTLQNATLDMNAADSGSVTFSQASTIGALTGSRALAIGANRLSVGNNNADSTYSGVVSGSSGLTKIGTGALTLGGASTYTGGTVINASSGTLAINSTGELYTPNYIATPVVTVNSGATLSLYAWSYGVLGSVGPLDLGAARLVINGGTITYTGIGEGSGSQNQGRLFTIGTGGATLDAEGAGTWYLEAASSGYDGTAGQVIPSSLTLTLTGAGNGRYDKLLSGAGSLIKSGAGTWTLAGVNTYTGDTTVNASSGTLQIGGAGQLNSGNYAGAVAIGSGSTFKYSSSASQTLSGTISGSGALTKDTSSASTLTLSGTVSYGGATTVSAGTLIVPSTHSGTGAASVSANATLGVTVSGTSQWQPASLSLANPCTLTFSSAQNSGTTTAPILPTTAVGAVSGVTVKMNSILGTATVGNSYPLLGNEGGTTNGFTLGAQPVGVVGHLAVNGTTLVYVVDTVSDIWAGTDATQPTYWTIGNIGTATNWTGYAVNNSPAYTFAQNDYVLFDDTATPASPVSVAIQAAVTPASVSFNNSTKNYTITASGGNMIGGSASLTMNNSGTVILTGGTNGYTGGTIISAGTLEADASGVLGTGLVTMGGGALSNNLSATLANPVNLRSAATVAVGSSQTLALSGAVTNTGALTKQGAGTLTLSGNNNFSGAIAVNAGTLNFSGGTTTYGSSSINVNNQLSQNSALQFSGGSFTAGGSAATRNLNLISNATLSVTGSASITVPGIISLGTAGAGSSGNLTLSGGTLNINGYDSVNNNRALIIGEYNSETSTFTMSGGTLNVPNGKTYVGWSGTGIWNMYGGTANVQSVFMSDPAAILTLTNGQLNIGSGGILGIGTIQLGGGTVSSSASWSTTNNATLTNLNGNVTFAPANNQTITWGGVLSGSTGGLKITGPGKLMLTNANTYTGNTTISGGTLALSGSGSLVSTMITVASNATFDVSGESATFALGSGTTLSNTVPGAVINGNNNTGSGIVALVYDGVNPSLIITNGTMTLSASTAFTVKNTGATLTPGTYKIIAAVAGGSPGQVAGTVPVSVTVVGGPVAGTPSLSIVGGELYLTVGGTSTFGYSGTSFIYNGSGQSPSISFSGSTAASTTNYVGTGATVYNSINPPVGAGTYYVSNSVAADANYFGATNTQVFTIAKATPSAVLAVNNSPATYNGSAQMATVVTNSSSVPGTVGNVKYNGSATLPTAAGTYAMTADFVPNETANYNTLTTQSAGNFVISPASLTITANNASKSYGQTVTFAGTEFSPSGLMGSDSVSSVTLTSDGATNTAIAGNYTIVPSAATGTGLGNYTIAYANGSLQVNPALLGVTADNQSRVYGATNPVFTVSYSGFVNGDTASVLSGSPVLTTAADTNSPVGGYVITNEVGTLSATNYTFSPTNGTLTITPADLAVTANDATRTYGAPNPAFSYSVTGFVNGDTASVISGSPVYFTLANTNSPASVVPYEIDIFDGLSATNYHFNYYHGNLAVTKAPLTVTANADSKTYDGNPYSGGNGVNYSGFVNGEDGTVLGGTLTYGGTAQGAVNAGSYTIAPSGLASGNYAISYTNGMLTISQAVSVITAAPTASAITYGQMLSDSTLSGGSATPSGGNFAFTAPSTIPPLGTAAYGVTYTPLDTVNYTTASTNVNVTVNPACTSPAIVGGISPGSLTATVGDQVVLAVTNAAGTAILSYQWLNNAVAIASATNSSYTNLSVLVSDAGNYQVVITNDCGAITSSVAVLTVNPQTPLVAALPMAATITYGQTLSAATLTGGSVTNAAGAVITGSFAYTNLSLVPNAGTAAQGVTFTPDDSTNYTGISTAVNVAVNPAALGITANSAGKNYGQTVTFAGTEFSTSGLTNGDSVTSVILTSAGAANTAIVGNYPVVPSAASGMGLGNYNITYNNGTLTVNPANLGVTADNASRAFGAANPTFTASYAGFVNGDTLAVVSGAPSLTTSADTNSVVGTYDIVAAAGSLSATNYTFSLTNGTLTVTPAAITVTADNQSRTYGAANPAFTASYTGFVNGDTSSVISGTPTLTTSADTNSAVGSYVITNALGGLSATNYSFTLVNGTLTVNPAALGITANNDSKTYDGVGYTGGNGVSYVGLVNGETSVALGGTLAYGGTSQNATNAGGYTIVPSGLTSTNYAISYTNGTLAINPLGVTVTANGQTKVYGTSDPALTYGFAPALVGGDSFSGALSRTAGENVGNHAIYQGTLALSANYTLTCNGTNLVITPAALNITANNAAKNYGQTVTFAGTEFSTSGLTNGDSVASVTLSSAGVTNTAAAGSYPIAASAASGTGLANYTISYTDGTLTVNVATAVTVNAPVQLPDGNFQLSFTGGDAGVSYQIQACEDLGSPVWSILTTMNGLTNYTDLDATNHPNRFYRTFVP